MPIALQNQLFEVFESLMETAIEGAMQSGSFDIGVETVRAESLVVQEEKVIATHHASGATTSLMTLLRKDRAEIMTSEEVLALRDANPKARLMLNRQSGRAALVIPTTSLMQDDGSVTPRVRLIRPNAREVMPVEALEKSQWREIDEGSFRSAWETEVSEIPRFTETRFHMVVGLLLPVWKQFPEENTRVYRLQTDCGQRLIGRLVSPATAVALKETLLSEAPALSAAEAVDTIIRDNTGLILRDGLTLKRSLVMGRHRIELAGFSDLDVQRLKSLGLISEIIAWKLRLFVPVGDDAAKILGRLFDLYPSSASCLRRVSTRPEGDVMLRQHFSAGLRRATSRCNWRNAWRPSAEPTSRMGTGLGDTGSLAIPETRRAVHSSSGSPDRRMAKAHGANGRTPRPANMVIFSISSLQGRDIIALLKRWPRRDASLGSHTWPPEMATSGMHRSAPERIRRRSQDASGTRESLCPVHWPRPTSDFGICLHLTLLISGFTLLWSIATTRPGDCLPPCPACSRQGCLRRLQGHSALLAGSKCPEGCP